MEATLNSILRESRREWPGGLSAHQYSTLNVIAHCRTGVLGSISERCNSCGHSQILPQSCGNRHCPLCLGKRAAEWSERVCQRLPARNHFHVVFTLPPAAAQLMAEDFRAVADVFFAAVNETLRTFMTNNLKSKGGYLCVLHTWGSNLSWHPHIHTIVSAGGYRLEDGAWRDFRDDYLFAVRALSRVFKAIFLRALESATLAWPGELEDPRVRREWRRALAARDWVVYAEPTLTHTRALVRYLARYTVRTAIGNRRIRRFDPESGTVTFTWRDYRGGGKTREMTLSVRAFIARFAAHIAPRGLRRVRYYGFLARPRSSCTSTLTEEPAAQPACRHCGAQNWTRVRLPAMIFSASHGQANPRRGDANSLTNSESRCASFSLHARAGPPLEVQQRDARDAGHANFRTRRPRRRS